MTTALALGFRLQLLLAFLVQSGTGETLEKPKLQKPYVPSLVRREAQQPDLEVGHDELGDEAACSHLHLNVHKKHCLRVLAAQRQQVVQMAKNYGFLTRGPYSGSFDVNCEGGITGSTTGSPWDAYAAFHRTCRDDPACVKGAILWRCEENDYCGGLGNEIEGLVSTFYLAVALKRPFFIAGWKRLGQNLLNFMAHTGIDTKPPEMYMPKKCAVEKWMDPTPKELDKYYRQPLLDDCTVFVTNANAFGLFYNKGLVSELLPDFSHIKPLYSVGCAMQALFKRGTINEDDKSYLGLNTAYGGMHIRTFDNDIEGKPKTELLQAEANQLEQALDCMVTANVGTVVLCTTSEAVKQKVAELASSRKLQILTVGRKAIHSNHSHDHLNQQDFLNSLWSDFVGLEESSVLISADFRGRSSSFSLVAASMGFMPEEKLLGTNCQPNPTLLIEGQAPGQYNVAFHQKPRRRLDHLKTLEVEPLEDRENQTLEVQDHI